MSPFSTGWYFNRFLINSSGVYEYSIFAMDMVGRRSMELDIFAFENFSDSLLLNFSRSFKVGNFTIIFPLLFWRVLSTRIP